MLENVKRFIRIETIITVSQIGFKLYQDNS